MKTCQGWLYKLLTHPLHISGSWGWRLAGCSFVAPNRGLQSWPLHVIWVSPITVAKFWEWEPEGQGRKEGTYTNIEYIVTHAHTFIIGSLCSALVGVFPQCKNAQGSFYGTIVSLPYHQIHFYFLSPPLSTTSHQLPALNIEQPPTTNNSFFSPKITFSFCLDSSQSYCQAISPSTHAFFPLTWSDNMRLGHTGTTLTWPHLLAFVENHSRRKGKYKKKLFFILQLSQLFSTCRF